MTAPATTSPQQIDSSCRLPLFVLFGGAAFWLALSSFFAMAASLTFHSPKMFADCPMFTYGRAFPAASNLLVYGFCIPAGLGVALWVLARLGRVEVSQPWVVAVGGKLWHLGVLVGLIGILTGDSTGHEWLEMPRYAAVILFLSFLFIAVRAFVTYSERNEKELYPSQWFILAALFWFPWIYSTATLLLQIYPVRGMAQASVAWWYSGNLLVVWLGLIGLGTAFYFLPKLLERQLQSYYLAFFAFLTLIFFGTWTGIPANLPLPAWLPSLSASAKVMMIVPLLAVATITILTCRGPKVACSGGPLCYTKAGLGFFVLAGLLFAATGFPQVTRVVNFTWFSEGQNALQIYGFFAMIIFGAVYYILPRVAGVDVCPKAMRAHFWLNVVGVVLLGLPLAAGGASQGMKLLNATIPFLDIAKSTLMTLRVSTLGLALILIGNLLFLFNVGAVQVRYYRAICLSAYKTATALEPAGVKP